jgi:hypothetical protein
MITRRALKQYLLLILYSLLIVAILLSVNGISELHIPLKDLLLLTGGFTIISLTALMIFFFGQNSNPEKNVFSTLTALGVKMLLSFILALLFFVVFKNRETGSVILFFVLYLAFTVFVFLTFLRIIKQKST